MTPGFFNTYGQRLVAGRAFTDRDRDSAPRVAIVNEAFARRFLNGGNPIGHSAHLYLTRAPEPDMEIVGVVGDAVYRRLRDPAPPTLYSPVAQTTTGPATTEFNMSVRAASESPAQLSRSIADAIGGVNPDLTLTFRPLAEQVSASLTQERIVAILSGFSARSRCCSPASPSTASRRMPYRVNGRRSASGWRSAPRPAASSGSCCRA